VQLWRHPEKAKSVGASSRGRSWRAASRNLSNSVGWNLLLYWTRRAGGIPPILLHLCFVIEMGSCSGRKGRQREDQIEAFGWGRRAKRYRARITPTNYYVGIDELSKSSDSLSVEIWLKQLNGEEDINSAVGSFKGDGSWWRQIRTQNKLPAYPHKILAMQSPPSPLSALIPSLPPEIFELEEQSKRKEERFDDGTPPSSPLVKTPRIFLPPFHTS
jgi:hypothetical protein